MGWTCRPDHSARGTVCVGLSATVAIVIISINTAYAQQQIEPATRFEQPAQRVETQKADQADSQDNNAQQQQQTEPDQQSPEQEPQRSQPEQPRLPRPANSPAPVRMERPELPPSLQRSGSEPKSAEESRPGSNGDGGRTAHASEPETISRPAGLLTQQELDLVAARINSKGTRTYRLYTGKAGQIDPVSYKQGLLLIRDSDHLQPVDGQYYGDGRGNRIRFGPADGAEGAPSYAMTLFAGGGTQLMVDTNGDRIIDVGVSEGLGDRFGFLATPEMQHALECMKRALQQGGSPAGALPACLVGNGSGAGGGGNRGGGLGGDPGAAVEPECGPAQPIAPGGRSRGGGKDVVGEFWSGENARDGKNHIIVLEDPDTGERTTADVVGWFGNDRDTRTLKIEDSETGDDLGTVKRKASGEKEHNPPSESDMEFSLEEAESAGEDDEPQGQSAGREQPGPGPGGIEGPTGGTDPRCQEPSTWNRLATEECATDIAHCINKMTDPLYSATGGQCRTAQGPDDSATVQCKGNDSFGECIGDGGEVRECAEQHAGGDGGGVTPGENDDIFNEDRGSLSYGLMDVHPFGAALAAMCNKGGGAGPCGDPAPTAGAAAERR